jgi:hypothetical protein
MSQLDQQEVCGALPQSCFDHLAFSSPVILTALQTIGLAKLTACPTTGSRTQHIFRSLPLSTVCAIKLVFLIAGEPASPIGIVLAHGQPGNRDAILEGPVWPLEADTITRPPSPDVIESREHSN